MITINLLLNKILRIENLFYLLAATFFFERIPSVETVLGPVRLYNVVILLLVFGFVAIFINNKLEFQKHTIPSAISILVLFLMIGSLSIINVVNVNRFIAAYISILFCCLTTFFLSIAKFDYDKLLKVFVSLFIFQALFAAYQFVGDKYLQLSPSVTGVKELFQSNVFGIPRVHTTYNEPAYFANALFLGIFLFLFLTFSKFIVFNLPINRLFYFIMTVVMFGLFWITLAKSAWLILPIPLLLALGLLFINIKSKIIQTVFTTIIMFILLGFGLTIISNPKIATSIGDQFVGTVEGNTATSIERKAYSDAAISLIPNNLILGIGPGQFGTVANTLIVDNLFPIDAGYSNAYTILKPGYNFRTQVETEKNITFNVYLEVLLEYGLVAFLFYLLLIFTILKGSIDTLLRTTNILDSKKILQLSLFMYVVCSLGQFFFISPVYINPFFVALGLLININHFDKTNQSNNI
jgi:O-antigen ligase